jgi:hypothetical protein
LDAAVPDPDFPLNATVVASMRNEGPFIVEWLCWYRMLGFARALVVTNACTDRSPQLLDALQAAGWVDHLVHEVEPGRPITAAKLKAARQHRAVTKADWVFVCDVDEFLVVHRGAGRLADLIGPAPDFLGMAIAWRVFGSDGRQGFEDIPVHRQFFGALRASRPLSGFVKTLYRHPRWFRKMGEHGPRQYKPHKGDFGVAGNTWVTADGRLVPGWQPDGDYVRSLPAALTSHAVAQVNHYMIRSEETFSLKAGTLAPVSLTDRYDAGYHDRASFADVIDPAALRYRADFDALWDQAMALPGVRLLHHQCCADHLTAIAVKAGRDPAADPRVARHLALAAEAGG